MLLSQSFVACILYRKSKVMTYLINKQNKLTWFPSWLVIIVYIVLLSYSVKSYAQSHHTTKTDNADRDQSNESNIGEQFLSDFSWVTFLLGKQVVLEFVAGGGHVSTGIIEQGRRVEVASGQSTQQGFRIASEPSAKFEEHDKYGWSTGFSPFAFIQSLDLNDIDKKIPSSPRENTDIIPAVVIDEAGSMVDPNDPNQANFSLDTWGLDYLLVGAFKLEQDTFLNVMTGIAIAEYRTSQAIYGKTQGEANAIQFFKSARMGFQYQRMILKEKHFDLIFRTSFESQYYWNVPLSNRIEFKHPTVTYNDRKQVFERKRVFVDDYEMTQYTLRLALMMIFN